MISNALRAISSHSRRAQEHLRHPEEACPVLQMQHIPIQERIEALVEERVVQIVLLHQDEEGVQREEAGRPAVVDARGDPVHDEDGAREVRVGVKAEGWGGGELSGWG